MDRFYQNPRTNPPNLTNEPSIEGQEYTWDGRQVHNDTGGARPGVLPALGQDGDADAEPDDLQEAAHWHGRLLPGHI